MIVNITKDGEVIASVDSMAEEVIVANGFDISDSDSEFDFNNGRWTVFNAGQAGQMHKLVKEYAEKEFLSGSIDSQKRELFLALADSYKLQMGLYLAIKNEYTTDDEKLESISSEDVTTRVENHYKG